MNNVPQNVLQGQNGGLSKGARTPQQNANMPTLNRAFGPQVTQPNMQAQQSTPQMAHQIGQQNSANPPHLTQNGGARPPMNQQQLHQMLLNIPEPERRAFMARMQAEQQKQRQQNGQSVAMQAQNSQQGQPMPPVGPQAVQNTQPTPRPGQQNIPPQQPVNGQSQTQQPQPQRNGFQLQQQKAAQAANNSLTSEQEQQMDVYPYPRGILATGNALSQLPDSVRLGANSNNGLK